MEIIIVSENSGLSATIIQNIDDCIAEYKMKKMELYSQNTYSVFDIQGFNTLGSYFVFIDIRKIKDTLQYCRAVMQKFIYGYFGIITDSTNNIITLINKVGDIHGCINVVEQSWKQELIYLLQKFENECIKFRQAITVYKRAIYYIIPYEQIDYIETIKGTHYCIIYHNGNKTEIRSNITSLMRRLDERFEIVKSSTIVNFQNLLMMDSKERKLVFQNNQCCYYSERYFEKIIEKLNNVK